MATPAPFLLLEGLRWDRGDGYFLLDRHLARLSRAAVRFGYPLEAESLRRSLADAAARVEWGAAKIRVELSSDGGVRLETVPMSPATPLRARLARTPVDSTDELLRFKTSRRDHFARERAAAPGADEIILWNERRELTETTTGNLVLELDGRRWTPPVASGLLPGTFREELLSRGEIAERVLTMDDLRSAARVFQVNSVRRWVKLLVEPPHPRPR